MLEFMLMALFILIMLGALAFSVVAVMDFVIIIGVMIGVFLLANQNGWLSLIAGSGMAYLLLAVI